MARSGAVVTNPRPAWRRVLLCSRTACAVTERGRRAMHPSAPTMGFSEGQNVFIIDDLLATGGTALATTQAILELKANISGYGFIVELSELGGRDVLSSYRLETLVNY